MLTEDGSRTRSHGLRPEVIGAQARALGLELLTGRGSWQTYEAAFKELLDAARGRGVTHVVFGDILLQEHKDWVERVCAERGLEAVEPLWREPTARLLEEFLAAGGEARIVAVNGAILGPEWLGRPLGLDLIPEFERLGVDPCGENGEYHTLVTRWPSFRVPIGVREAGRARHSGYWALDLELTG